MKKNKVSFFVLVASLFIIFQACDSNRFYENNVDFNNETWNKDSILIFNVEIDDTQGVYNVYLNNRINSLYGYSNLYLFVKTQLPNNQLIIDTVECILLNPKGKPLGKGFGNIWTNKIPYRINVRFPYAGNYKFYIEQAMRDDNLQNIVSAGLRIEKVTR